MASSSSAPAGVKSALRTLDLIEYVVARSGGVAAQDISTALSIPMSSLSYLLATLVERDYLRRDGRRYFAGIGLDRLRRPPSDYSLADRARPLIKSLGNQLDETTSLFVPVGWEMEAILTETSSQTLRYAIEVGTRTPLHCVAAGKALLATLSDEDLDRFFDEVTLERYTPFTITDPSLLRKELAEVRKTGIGYTRDEYTVGMTGVGTAVHGPARAIAAIGVASPTPRYDPEMEKKIIEQLVGTARLLEQTAGGAAA